VNPAPRSVGLVGWGENAVVANWTAAERQRWAGPADCGDGPKRTLAPIMADRVSRGSLRATSRPRRARLPQLALPSTVAVVAATDRARPRAAPGAQLPYPARGGAALPRVMGGGCRRRRFRASDGRVDRPVHRRPGVSLGLIAYVGVLRVRATRGARASSPVTPTARATPLASSGPANGRMVFRGFRKP